MTIPLVKVGALTSTAAPALRDHDIVALSALEADMARLVPSLDLVHRVIEAAASYTVARMQVLEAIPGNPIGIAFRRTDNAVALMARHLPSPAFNSVVGLRQGQAAQIEPLVDWYREHGLQARFEIAAGDDDPALGRELARLGFFPSGCHAALVGEPDLAMAAPEDGSVELVTTADQMEAFLAAYVAGWSIPDAAHDQFKRNVRPWLGQKGWSLYLARAEGRPAATAILFLRDGVGYCADSSTDPAFRGRGLHAALLRRRVCDARAAGVDLVCSGADFLSTSHRNMERSGLRLVFLRSIWTPLG
jgi:GNAT superfamily N-acetyltransferase